MTATVETMGARGRPDDQLAQLFGDGWPAFITADQVVKEHIGAVRLLFGDSLVRAVEGHEAGAQPDTLVVMAAQVHPDRRGQGLAGELLTAMCRLADQRGWPVSSPRSARR